jgi:hypothetical protein
LFGPGDPAATGKYAVPVIQKVIASGTPTGRGGDPPRNG